VLAILQFLIAQFQLILVPICFILAWGFLIALGGTFWVAVRDTTHQAKTMHQVPCPNCQFFTNDHRLKCTVKPTIANTEEAIDCSDYCPKLSI